MPFTLDDWKTKFKQALPDLAKKAQRVAMESPYALLAAAAVGAAFLLSGAGGSAVDPLSVLTGIISVQGANILSSYIWQLREWQLKEKKSSMEDLVKKIKEDSQNMPEIRMALDEVLLKLNAVSQAREISIPEFNQNWLRQTLREELQRLGNWETFRPLIEVETINIIHIYQYYRQREGTLDEVSFHSFLHEYLGKVISLYNRARLFGDGSMRSGGNGTPRKNLTDVFAPLSLKIFHSPSRDDIEQRIGDIDDDLERRRSYLKAVEEIRAQGDDVELSRLLKVSSRLAMIGGAGSGKSTVVDFLAVHLAQGALNLLNHSLPKPTYTLPFELPQNADGLIPLVVSLRAYQQYKNDCSQNPTLRLENPRTGTIAGFIPWELGRSLSLNMSLPTLNDFFHSLLSAGGCLLMLDGLDEVVNRSERARVCEQIERVTALYPNNSILVTAREAGYGGDAVFSTDFNRLDVQTINKEQMRILVSNWCLKLYPAANVEDQTESTLHEIAEINKRYENRQVPPLISTPLMVTMVISVKWSDTKLPRERARLYEAAVKVVLNAQYVSEGESRDELVKAWGGGPEDQREWLQTLALHMHSNGEGGAAVPEEFVRRILAEEMDPPLKPEQIDQFILAVRSRGGLFEERAELFQFVHLTFQEFLAARCIVMEEEQGWTEELERHIPESWWRETFLLTCGFAWDLQRKKGRKYITRLSNQPKEKDTYLAGLELAAAASLEIEQDSRVQQEQACLLRDGLTDKETSVPAVVRVRAGNTLSSLGDPRFNPDFYFLPCDDNLGFIHIPAGPFLMGSDKNKDSRCRNEEMPQHTITLNDYWIAKYPVTVAQWISFVKYSGHKPKDDDSLKGVLNHPVRYITWHEALKYCTWLSEKLRDSDQTPEALRTLFREQKARVLLPSEAEWEKAARGVDGLIYPWGNEFNSQKANTDETGIGTTSPVGCFPQGASPYGSLDMSGNVWEWTRSLDKSYPYKSDDGRENLGAKDDQYRVLRGGAFAAVKSTRVVLTASGTTRSTGATAAVFAWRLFYNSVLWSSLILWCL